MAALKLSLWGMPVTVALAAFVGPTAPEVAAQGIDPSLLEVFEWRNVGPLVAGRSIAVAGSVARKNEYYAGATGGGLWKTTDGAHTWHPVSDGSFGGVSVGSVGICANDPDVVYVGTGEGQWRGTISTGDGAYVTRDGGRTWAAIGLDSETGQIAIARMRVHPRDCEVVYAAVLGDPYGPNKTRGIYRTRDGGRSWQRVLFRNDHSGGSDLMLDPSDPNVIYATIWDAYRPPWGGRTTGTSGIFKSVDGGDTWEELTHKPGMPDTTAIGKSSISVSAADPNRVYADIEAEPGQGGVYRSDDGGETWTLVNGNTALFHRAEYYTRIFADPQDADIVHVLNKNWFMSRDGGRTYEGVEPPHGDNHDLWIDPTDNQRWIQGNDGGATVTNNGGRTWSDQDYSTAQMYHAFITEDYPYLICGGQQDNSSKCVPSDGSGSFYYEGAGGEQGYIAQHPEITTLAYGGSQRGGLVLFDRKSSQRKSIEVWPWESDGYPVRDQPERWQWTFPIIMSPHDPEVVYVGSQHVWKTTDRGMSWERISPDLTRAEPETLTGSNFPIKDHVSQDYYAVVFTIAASPHDPDVIWAGSDDGLIHVTRDGGASWQNVTPPDLPEFARASLIVASPHTPGKAYLAAEKYKLQDVNPYIFKTEDYGHTWTKIVNGIPWGHFVRAVKEDPVKPGLLYAGTERGPYVSLDDGRTWVPLSLNLPNVQVSDVEIAKNDVVVSTYGRGFWILDGAAAVLRQLPPRIAEEPLLLFEPSDVIRSRAGPLEGVDDALYGRTRLPWANRADVYYHLASPAREVTIDVLDSTGELVRRFSSATEPWQPVRSSVGQVINNQRWGSATPVVPPSTGAGLHRFVWDLLYPPAADFPGLRSRDANVNGPVAPPGEYQVRLTADGRSETQVFRIQKDPRLKGATQEDLEAQFALDMRVHQRTNDLTSAVLEIRRIKESVDDRIQRASDQRLSREGTELKEHLTSVEGELYQFRTQTDDDIKHFGHKLFDKFQHVTGVIRSDDSRPTRATYQVLDELEPMLDAQLSRLTQILSDELARFNRLLEDRGLPPIRVARAVVSQ